MGSLPGPRPFAPVVALRLNAMQRVLQRADQDFAALVVRYLGGGTGRRAARARGRDPTGIHSCGATSPGAIPR